MLPLELLDEVVDEAVVKVLIEGSSTEIENEDVALAGGLLVKTVRDSGRSGLVDDTEDVGASNRSDVLGRLTLRVVEVHGGGDDSGACGRT